MAWKDDRKSYEPGPGTAASEPGTHGVRRGEAPMDTVRSVRHGGPKSGGGYTRSEMPVISDGQLGDANLESGPEWSNPEGSVDISNNDVKAVEMASRAAHLRRIR